ncbi:MAG: type II toxin-antitoxin system VapC family toxin [Acetobacteraceae bacterium]|nr:type II toxin-antitoxin system VapC family toxin [Acetobacteraceae bacterium]
MVIDTLAIVAILFDEPDGQHVIRAIERNELRLMSAVRRGRNVDGY